MDALLLTWIIHTAANHINSFINVRFVAFNFAALNLGSVVPFTMSAPMDSNINSWKFNQIFENKILRLIGVVTHLVEFSPRRQLALPGPSTLVHYNIFGFHCRTRFLLSRTLFWGSFVNFISSKRENLWRQRHANDEALWLFGEWFHKVRACFYFVYSCDSMLLSAAA